jgi:hypothetical protein
MKILDLQPDDVGEIDGERFIVIDKFDGSNWSSRIDVIFENGKRVMYLRRIGNPEIKYLGKGKLVTKIEVIK